MPALTEYQRVELLQYVPRVPAALSIVGSGLILVAVSTRRGALRTQPYHRMMFSLSLYDLLGAAWTALGSLPVPEEYGIPGSMGNLRVCSVQGFFIHWTVIATNIYNAAIVVYFLLKVRFNVSDREFSRRIEPAVHVAALALSLAFALAGQILGVFNPIGFGGPSNSPLCYIQAFPPGCDFVPGAECTRGANARAVIWYIAIGPFMVATLILLVSLGVMLRTVTIKARKSRQFRFRRLSRSSERRLSRSSEWRGGSMVRRCSTLAIFYSSSVAAGIRGRRSSQERDDAPPEDEETTAPVGPLPAQSSLAPEADSPKLKAVNGSDQSVPGEEAAQVETPLEEKEQAGDNSSARQTNGHRTSARARTTGRRTRRSRASMTDLMALDVGKRCLVYGVVFLNTFLWTSISMIVHNKEPPEWNSFWLGVLAFIFMPLQGFLNFMIYISPRYKRTRRANPGRRRLWALWRSVCHGSDTVPARI